MLLHGIEINPIWESVGYPAIIQAVSEGLGLSVVPHLFVKKDLELGNVKQIKIKNISLKHQFYVIHHKNKYLTSSAKEFMNYFLT